MGCNHIRTSSASTGGGGGRDRALSVFSEGYQTATTAPTSPATSLPGYSSLEDDEIFEIDKETFEMNVQHSRKDSCQSEKPSHQVMTTDKPEIIDGSTLGGNDPFHSYIRIYGMEPRWWIEERQREERKSSRPPMTKRKRPVALVNTAYLDPEWYDALPYSRQDAFTSGLDMDADPETTSQQFWDKVQSAWNLSVRYESVDERRDAFEEDSCRTEPSTPKKRDVFRQEWFKEELTVGDSW